MGGLRAMATDQKIDKVWASSDPYWDLMLLHTEALVDNVRKSCREDPEDLAVSQHPNGGISLRVSYRLARHVTVEARLRPDSKVVRVEYRTNKTLRYVAVPSLIEASRAIRWLLILPAFVAALFFKIRGSMLLPATASTPRRDALARR